MPPPPTVFLRSVLLALTAALAPIAHAQHYIVVVEANGAPRIVKGALAAPDGIRAEISGQKGTDLHASASTDFRVANAPVWGPGLIDVSDLKTEVAPDRKGIRIHGTLKSDTTLPNCFIVLLASAPGTLARPDNQAHPIERALKLCALSASAEPSQLPVGQAILFDQEWNLPPTLANRPGACELHFFSNGLEIPTTAMTDDQIAAARAKTEAYVLRNHPDSQIALRQIVNPTYPEELKGQNLAGSATLRCHVDSNGNVSAVEVVSATNPAFGDAAVKAARQWKFAPAVRDHHYIAQTAELPIAFNPPNPAPGAAAGAAPAGRLKEGVRGPAGPAGRRGRPAAGSSGRGCRETPAE